MRSIIIVLLLSVSVMASPTWYYKVQNTKSSTYIGYGSGIDESAAKQEAFNDIVSQISLSVESKFTQKQDIEDGALKTSEHFSSSQNSKATLNDYKLLKSEFKDGKYFVAVAYENIPSLDKFIRKVKSTTASKDVDLNSYLKHTLIATKLKKALKKELDFSLLRKDKKWFIKHKTILQVLDKKDFGRFFASVESKNISITTNKKNNILYDNDKFYFKIKSAKKGFVSIFTVYEDGTVSTLVRNIAIDSKGSENIPDEDFESIPEAGLMEKTKETYDLYIGLYTDKKIHFDSFAYADDELICEEKYKNFDTLIEFLDDKTYATLKVTTKPRL